MIMTKFMGNPTLECITAQGNKSLLQIDIFREDSGKFKISGRGDIGKIEGTGEISDRIKFNLYYTEYFLEETPEGIVSFEGIPFRYGFGGTYRLAGENRNNGAFRILNNSKI